MLDLHFYHLDLTLGCILVDQLDLTHGQETILVPKERTCVTQKQDGYSDRTCYKSTAMQCSKKEIQASEPPVDSIKSFLAEDGQVDELVDPHLPVGSPRDVGQDRKHLGSRKT